MRNGWKGMREKGWKAEAVIQGRGRGHWSQDKGYKDGIH